MLTRCSSSRALRLTQTLPRIARSRPGFQKNGRRLASTSSGPAGNASQNASSSSLSVFGGLTSELDRIAPRFEISADQVVILKGPTEFYEVLKTKISSAKRRIYISTLYFGRAEHDLIATLRNALQRNPDLRLSILTDALRGTREAPNPSCASLLAPLVAEFGPRVEVKMFHTPNLTGWRKAILPKRINEGWGLQHMKLYGIDDEIIMSGANLSSDYFTDRQDRYHVFVSKQLTEYYERIHTAICSISFNILSDPSTQSGFAMTWPDSNSGPSPLDDPKAYRLNASNVLTPLIKPSAISDSYSSSTQAPIATDTKTLVYPLFQLAPLLSTSTELPALTFLLRALASAPFAPARWTFTAGYFNMTPGIRDLLLESLQASASPCMQPHGTVLTAHPEANGFFGSAGISGMLPPAYTLLAKRFLVAAHKRNLADNVTLREWKRGTIGQPDGWTYHAKGLWMTLPSASGTHDDTAGTVTLVGSSNYTARSHALDLEANALVVTTDPGLQSRLRGEEEHLMEYAGKDVTLDEFARTERRVGLHVRIALWIVGVVGGAL